MATRKLGIDVYDLRAELPTHHEQLHTNMNVFDISCETSLAAAQLIAKDAATELGN